MFTYIYTYMHMHAVMDINYTATCMNVCLAGNCTLDDKGCAKEFVLRDDRKHAKGSAQVRASPLRPVSNSRPGRKQRGAA